MGDGARQRNFDVISPNSAESGRHQGIGGGTSALKAFDTVGRVREPGADHLVPLPSSGRVFTAERRVRFGDVSPGGRCRFDALADYVQDVAGDDTADAGLPDESAWVVRRSVVEVARPATFRELLALQTFCSGTGGRWAERRVVVRGDRGAEIDSVSLWVRIDAETGRPRNLSEEFLAVYGSAAGGRRVSAQLRHDAVPPDGLRAVGWPLRFTDFDLLGHVNNAVGWAVVEQELAAVRALTPPYRAELEYRDAIERDASLSVTAERRADRLRVWVRDRVTGVTHLTASVTPLD
jgi:acyl-ACP thioesterase